MHIWTCEVPNEGNQKNKHHSHDKGHEERNPKHFCPKISQFFFNQAGGINNREPSERQSIIVDNKSFLYIRSAQRELSYKIDINIGII